MREHLNETETCMRLITPALKSAGWDIDRQVRREVGFTAGQIMVRGSNVARGKRKRADYLLQWKANFPLAIVEAKDTKHGVSDGMQQALSYADTLDVPFVFSSNGKGFLFHDKTASDGPLERELRMDEFPSPEELWQRFRTWKGLSDEQVKSVLAPYFDDVTGKEPRYYQRVAINRTIEAIARGQDRILLVMATGTGKTYTAFQIIWRLWKAKKKQRILFLADRNILVDQTITNDFKPFGQAMTKIRKRQVDKSYEVYLALYQGISGTEEEQNAFKQFSPDFFDLVVIDECHRSSAKEASRWHEILNYFSSATQIGLTATPKETRDVSNIGYFGEPVYIYSLKQGIEDGFLAPYKVIRVDLDRDLEGWRPEKGQRDDAGEEIEDRIYNQKDFDRELVLTRRTEMVAQKVIELLEGSGKPYAKTIVFCEDIDHAERMRAALVNANPTRAQEDRRYVMRITGDNEEGKRQLDHFIDPAQRYPVIATTSKLMSTGVDAKTCEFIVLDQRIQSMTEFKQIIGRGTRIHEDTGKLYFTIVDFKKATELFADPEFDGAPVQVYEPDTGGPVVPPDDEPSPDDPDGDNPDGPFPPDPGDDDGPRYKYRVSNVPVSVVAERVQYYGTDGKLITESLRDYTRRSLLDRYASLDDFLQAWHSAERKQAILDELKDAGLLLEALEDQVSSGMDPFDLVLHVVYDRPPLTRKERADRVRKSDIYTKFGEQARTVLDALLDKYSDQGIVPIEKMQVLQVQPFNTLGTPLELVGWFGGRSQYQDAVTQLERELYRTEDAA
ncbi:MAG: DEAD/DEAH box helicase family protein [Planctomycetota bacterium]